jgi:hypothetical protein
VGFLDQLVKAVREWDRVLLCASRHSLRSWWVDTELEAALEEERRRRGTLAVLIPLNLDGYMLSKGWKSGKAPLIRSRYALDFVDWDSDESKYRRQLPKLLRALRKAD